MSRRTPIPFVSDETGAVLVELAFVMGVFLLLVLALIDFSRLGYTHVQANAATGIAARMTAVRAPLCPGVPDFVGRTTSSATSSTANGTACSAVSNLCAAPQTRSCTAANNPAADAVWSRIAPLLPTDATREALSITYSYDAALNRVGAGYAPVVTVELTGLTFRFVSPLGALAAFASGTSKGADPAAPFTFPSMSASLPGEDLR